ncbi:MAG: DMT family transporter [Candidatus Saccharibacteria bacterium]
MIYPLVILAVLCMSLSSILVRFSTAPPAVIAFFRLAMTALIGAGLGVGAGQLASITKKHLAAAIGAGFFLSLHFGFWITSLSYTSIASSVLFTNLQVIFVWLFSVLFLKEKVSRLAAGGIIIALAGSIFIGGGDFFSGHLLGDMISLASGLFVAIYMLIGRKIRGSVDIWPYTTVVSAAAACFLGLYAILNDLAFTSYPALDYLLFGLMALIPGIGGHAILNWALKYLKAPLVAVAILGESVGAAVLGYLIFHESLAWFQVAGGALVLTGIYMALFRASEESQTA